MSENYQAFLDKRCEKLGTKHFSSELLLKEQMIIPV